MVKLDDNARKLVEDNMLLVQYIILRYYGYEIANDEDIVSECYIALCRAAAQYDPAKKTAFSTYAGTAIKHCVDNLFAEHSRKKRTPPSYVVSLNTPVNDDDPESPDMIEFIPDERVNIEDQVMTKIQYDAVASLVPMHVDMYGKCMSIMEYAKAMKKPKASIGQKLMRERKRARPVLEEQGWWPAAAQ